MITCKDNIFIIKNKLFSRTLEVNEHGLRTTSVINIESSREYEKRPDSAEFQVNLNGKITYSYHKPEYHILDGNLRTTETGIQFTGSELTKTAQGSEILKLSFDIKNTPASVSVFYEIYPNIPGCSKWLEFSCTGDELHINKLLFEILNTCPGRFVDSNFYIKHGRVKTEPMFAANGDEDIVQLHNNELDEGIYIGITAPGPMRYFMVYPHWPSGISCGYNMSSADFNIFLKKGESFTTDKTLMMVYTGKQDDQKIRNTFREMIRLELPQTVDNGEPMYCTWLPFLKNINETLLFDMAERAAKMGFKYFVVDDGWFVDGEWRVDKEKFPNGLEVISEKVKALGMKFGLWFNIGNDYGNLGSCPEDNALDYHGGVKTFGPSDTIMTRCMASIHRDKMVEKLTQLTNQYGVDYFKLDFSAIVSPYGIMPYGCHSTEHAYHNDFSDSVMAQYRSMDFLKDSLKERFSDLIIDFSFETYGTDAPSIGSLLSSELQHITNCNTMHPELLDAFRIRQTVYNFSNLLPVERILGSLINIEGEHAVEHFMTPFTGAPLGAGDLRNVSSDDCKTIAEIAKTWAELNKKEQLINFYRLRGSLAVTHHDWDGFARFNSQEEGVLFIFKNGYKSSSITLQLDIFKNDLTFYDAVSKEPLGTYSSKQLTAGITVDWFRDSDCKAVVFS